MSDANAPCDRSPAGAETHSGSVHESAVTGSAGQAPPSTPLPEEENRTRDDLREALGNELNLVLLDGGNSDEIAEQFLAGPLAPILAQVSALQAEVEVWRETFTDEAGTTWPRPDAKLYAKVWAALHRHRDRAEALLSENAALKAEVERLQKGLDLAADEATSHRNAAVAALRERDAVLERLQKVEGERGRLERALGVAVAVLDRAAGEGIMFLPGDDGSPEMDAADACEIISTVIEAEIDGPVWRALLATGWKRLSPSDNPLTETKEGSDA